MNVSDLGEFGLIERLAKAAGASKPEGLIVGIGDDAAAWRVNDAVMLATTDTLVEGVHFLAGRTPWADLGWKALAVNVSDIAAMGGLPQYALVTLALPPQTAVPDVDALYEGLGQCAREYGATVTGGDVVRAPQVVITVAVLGRAEVDADGRPQLMRRDGARAGYAVAVTGTLGDSAAGLRRLNEGAPADDPLVRAHLRPRPPLAAARRAVAAGVPCAIDISDGLLQDLGHVCEMSGLGAVVRAAAVPVSDELRDAYPDDALALACAGGEDYELLLVAPAETLEALGPEITVIGEMVEHAERRPRLVDGSGEEIRLPAAVGWDHLRTEGRPSGRT
ncbi:MAG: thiamine-phosphate kinase [Dehalococcoidia bacterium]|nr:thiamine-phosphate kinase [Dehalococcoidia bacterium]